MDYVYLFNKQRELDAYIEDKLESTDRDDLFRKKIVALQVEIGELANETRCFKFWSRKGPSEQSVILEEYVDGLHFILSLGLDKGLTYAAGPLAATEMDQTDAFLELYRSIGAFYSEPVQGMYEKLFHSFLQLGRQLGFTEASILEAYQQKNEVNHTRQDEGY
ncbi:dUTPase [Virgibacillus sp. 7505]|uniref:dUTP diphosphatase n=1 Tax=Virgibacillus sp. 7505 TaxID=2022548 RepID=UPI000BA6F6F0|nr:dUTP diphosphatase [Virgibacillus sp. 7505]PAE17396.1 dUTPase [Virgibacillus sp. 7505]